MSLYMWSKWKGFFGSFYGTYTTAGNGLPVDLAIKESHTKLTQEQERKKSMNKWSQSSESKLETLNTKLMNICNEVLKNWDCTILWGYRNKEQQEEMVRNKVSPLHFPYSLHNRYPSRAVDLCPYPIPDWKKDLHFFRTFGGYVLGVGDTLGIHLRWGGDWDSDKDFNDQTFNDLVHFELRKGE